MYGNPTFDPSLLVSHDEKAVRSRVQRVGRQSRPRKPHRSSTASPAQTYPPGSTFKVITTAAMFDHNPSLTTQVLPTLSSLPLPETNLLLHNFGGESCGGALQEILAFSCDTAYAKIGLELGADKPDRRGPGVRAHQGCADRSAERRGRGLAVPERPLSQPATPPSSPTQRSDRATSPRPRCRTRSSWPASPITA